MPPPSESTRRRAAATGHPPSTVFPSVARSPQPGIIARDGTRDYGARERDDGKSPDFEVNLGKVISTLRADYPRILSEPPSFDIFTEEIELRDPVRSGKVDLLDWFSWFVFPRSAGI